MVFEDRVAKHPGRWTMAKSDGTSEIVTLIRNDEPIKEGTPINASTLNELSTVAGAINAKEEAVLAAQAAASERAKAEQAATNSANAVKADLKEYLDKAVTSASNAAESEKNAKASANAAQEHQTGAEAAQKKAEDAADRAAAIVSTDKTLTVENAPADAKAVGEALKNLNIRPATSTTLGGIKVGSGLSVADDGTLSADIVIPEVDKLTAYPVGSIFQTVSTTSPAALFGGTWQEIAQNRVLMGASYAHAAGTTVEAGLPNITGRAGPDEQAGFYNVNRPNAYGAFYGGGKSYDWAASGTSTPGKDLCFDASRSNPIYGRSNTVQPAAYYVHIWRRVA
nr:MAG TPA: baseplate protein [Caudoviricetes sp.]